MTTTTLSLPTGARMFRRSFLAVALTLGLGACDSLLDTSPPDQVDDTKAVQTQAGARAALAGAYGALQSGYYYGGTLTHFGDLYADNAVHTGTFVVYQEASNKDLRPDSREVQGAWNDIYEAIKRANVLIARVPNITFDDPVEQDQILGEAHFLRALNYFNLVRMYGGVPLRTTPVTDANEAANITRSTEAEVYAQILQDLSDAEGLITNTGSTNHANVNAVHALRAKVYLTQGNNAGALTEANIVQAQGYSLPASYSDNFNGDDVETSETIFRLTFTSNLDQNNLLGYYWQTYSDGGRYEIAPSQSLMNAYDTLGTDARLTWNIKPDPTDGYTESYASSQKWPTVNGGEDLPILRYADMLLTKAEAFANLGNVDSAVAYYNPIRTRAGLPAHVSGVDVTTAQQALDEIDLQRRLEFFGEGHRFFDLVRMGRFVPVATPDAFRVLWPIPQSEITVAPNITQNPGY